MLDGQRAPTCANVLGKDWCVLIRACAVNRMNMVVMTLYAPDILWSCDFQDVTGRMEVTLNV